MLSCWVYVKMANKYFHFFIIFLVDSTTQHLNISTSQHLNISTSEQIMNTLGVFTKVTNTPASECPSSEIYFGWHNICCLQRTLDLRIHCMSFLSYTLDELALCNEQWSPEGVLEVPSTMNSGGKTSLQGVYVVFYQQNGLQWTF